MDYGAKQPICETSSDLSHEKMLQEHENDELVYGCGECLNMLKQLDCARDCFQRQNKDVHL